jgi:uncharacterized protein HemX
MSTLTKILAALAFGLSIVVGIQTVRVYQLQAAAAKADAAHATALAKAHQDQTTAVSKATSEERAKREARERQVAALTRELATMMDYHEKITPVLHRHIDGMLQRAAESGGLVPAGAGASPRPGTDSSGAAAPGR